VGRQKIRDFLDCLYLHDRYLHIGALAWAAAAKDPGLTPDLIIDWAARGNRFQNSELADVRLGQPVDLRDLKKRWLVALDQARDLIGKLPPSEVGCLYLNAQAEPVTPDPQQPVFKTFTRHFGSVKGAWPKIATD